MRARGKFSMLKRSNSSLQEENMFEGMSAEYGKGGVGKGIGRERRVKRQEA